MGRSILAVLGGFIAWSVLWLSYNIGLRAMGVLPSDDTQPLEAVTALIALLIGSIILSLLAGYVAAMISRSRSYGPIAILAAVLLAVGIFFQSQYWQLMPLWYHLTFLGLLLPVCFLGARLRFATST
jgi:hypothetical protein